MTTVEGPLVKRHKRAAFDYGRLFNGQVWELGPQDLGGRTLGRAYDTIRAAAWRHRKVVDFEFQGDRLRVQSVGSIDKGVCCVAGE